MLLESVDRDFRRMWAAQSNFFFLVFRLIGRFSLELGPYFRLYLSLYDENMVRLAVLNGIFDLIRFPDFGVFFLKND